jgi:hypothetical protein
MEKLALTLPGGNRVDPIPGMPSGGASSVAELIAWGFRVAFIVIIVAAFIFLIVSGIQWIASQGDKGKIEAARKRLIFSIVGLVVAFSAFLIIDTVGDIVGVNLLNIRNVRTERGACSNSNPRGACSDPKKSCRKDDDGRFRCLCNPRTPGCAF